MNTTPLPPYAVPLPPEQEERQRIKRDANFVGFLLIALLAGQLLISALLGVITALGGIDMTQDDYGLGNTAYLLMTMLQYLLYLAVPVLVVALIARRGYNPFPTRRVQKGTYAVVLFGGVAMAVLANVAASYILSFLTALGVPYPEIPDSVEPTVISLLLNVVATAVLPALIEEMAFRGYILGALRPYGDKLAIVFSAVLFGLIHGNVLQLPFALILGLVLGWLTVQTECIWPAVVLHFANNLMSVLLSWVELYTDGDTSPTVLTFLFFCVTGAIVFVAVFLQKRRHGEDLLRPVGNRMAVLPVSKRVWAVITAPAMLVGGIAWLLILAVSLVV